MRFSEPLRLLTERPPRSHGAETGRCTPTRSPGPQKVSRKAASTRSACDSKKPPETRRSRGIEEYLPIWHPDHFGPQRNRKLSGTAV